MPIKDDKDKVVKLRQPQTQQPAAGVVVTDNTTNNTTNDDPIKPKSFLTMTDLEQDTFITQLRERRMRVVEILKRAQEDRNRVATLGMLIKIDKKRDQVARQLERATNSLERLEELVYDLRALHLQHTDTDISKPGAIDGSENKQTTSDTTDKT